jgi:methionyl-tRNA formyltransferase
MKVLFFGTPHFAADILQHLIDNAVDVVGVVTQPDRPQGRSKKLVHTPVKAIALQHNIPVFQPEKASAPEAAAQLEALGADLFAVAAYGEIIKDNLLNMPPLGCINVHASILPDYRGAAPIQRCVMNGDTESGVTIMYMAKKMDAGDIIEIAKTPIGEDMTAGELEIQLRPLGANTLLKVLGDFEKGAISREVQDHEKATFAPKMTTEECEVVWDRPCRDVHDHVRGVTPRPGAWCYVTLRGEKKRMKILTTRCEDSLSGTPGQCLGGEKKELTVACREGSVRILELQPEGKKKMSAEEFLRGFSLKDITF